MSNVPGTGSFFIRVVDCGNHGRSGGGRDGRDDRDGHGGRRGGCRIHRIVSVVRIHPGTPDEPELMNDTVSSLRGVPGTRAA